MKELAISPSFLLAVPAMFFNCSTSCRACATDKATVKPITVSGVIK